MRPSRFLLIPAFLVFFVACQQRTEVFTHGLSAGSSVPWLSETFDDAGEKFTFGIVTDLNGGEREGIFQIAVEQLNLLRPELIVTVGDLVEGTSSNADSIAAEYDHFDARARKAKAPLFHVGGNHDLTDPVMRQVWKDRYGAHYYYFVYKNVLFLMLDTEDHTDERRREIHEARQAAIKVMDGPEPEKARDMEYFKMPERVTGNIGDEQASYFQKVIADHPEVYWTVLFMHKPVWKREGAGSLEPLEKSLANRPYTVFNGHFHSYSHTLKNDKDHIILGTTGGHQGADDPNSFDHVTFVTMTKEGPSIANLRLDGILDKTAHIPLKGDSVCFQASRCGH
ncbi:MAG: metallophosphoesterase [Cyclobacteriaceae bacterium]|nr:metallophosphoesterase [Cyclobacteriaceae bacterium]